MKPQTFSFTANLPLPFDLAANIPPTRKLSLKAIQLPVVSNTATTGHKLQGATIDDLFVHAWNYSCTSWVYVVLSRVRTMKGLIFRKPLKWHPASFSVPGRLTNFLRAMKATSPTFTTDDMQADELRRHFDYPYIDT
jgi:hypothetical protein